MVGRHLLGTLLGALLLLGPAGAGADDSARPWLGVMMGRVDATGAVRVEHVVRGSPADRSGVHTGDRILEVDHAPVQNARDVIRLVGRHQPGDVLSVHLVQAGHDARLSVTLAEMPSGEDIVRMDHIGSPAPSWAGLSPPAGFPSSIESLRGRVVLVDFWATWCGACRVAMPTLSDWQRKYAAQGLTVVGITTDTPEAAALYHEQSGLSYAVASDPDAQTSAAYGVSALPTLFIVDRRGVVREILLGYNPDEDARTEALVRSLLASPP